MSVSTNDPNALAVTGQPSGPAPEARIALIRGHGNHIVLGGVIALTKVQVSATYLLLDGPDVQASALARSLGVEVIDTGNGGLNSALNSILMAWAPCTLVALNGDGSHDPDRIPSLIEHLSHGFDVAIGAYHKKAVNENVLAMNGDLSYGLDYGFVVSSFRGIEHFIAREGGDIGEQIIGHAKSAGLNIRFPLADGADADLLGLYKISAVVPAYNEELLIGETIRGIPPYVKKIYVIDDGSTDRTPDVLKAIKDPRLVAIRHEKNQGVGAAIITGYKRALMDEMDIAVVLDGDNQMDATELPRLLMPIIEGKADYTKGNRLISRKFRTGMSRWRSFGNFLLSMITKIGSGYWHIMDAQNGYTAISRTALKTLDLDSVYTYYGYLNDLLIKLNAYGMRTVNVPMPARYGKEKSSIKYGKYIRSVAPMIFRGFLWRLKTKYMVLDFHPLVFLYATSMLLVPAGLLLSIWTLAWIALYGEIPAALSLFAAVITLAGLEFLFFAMIFDKQADISGRQERIRGGHL